MPTRRQQSKSVEPCFSDVATPWRIDVRQGVFADESCYFATPLRGSAFFDQRAADYHPLNLICAFVDLGDLGIAHVFFNRIISTVAITTKQLNGVRSYFHRGVGCENF